MIIDGPNKGSVAKIRGVNGAVIVGLIKGSVAKTRGRMDGGSEGGNDMAEDKNTSLSPHQAETQTLFWAFMQRAAT